MCEYLISELDHVKEAVNVLHAVVPEEQDLAFGHLLGTVHHQFHYIVEMSTQLVMKGCTYLLLCGSFLGLMSSLLNQAK